MVKMNPTSYNAQYYNTGMMGYSSNQGIWAKVQLEEEVNRSPFVKKRKKWYQSFGGDPAIYQILESSREEEEAENLLPLLRSPPKGKEVNIKDKSRQISPLIQRQDSNLSRKRSPMHTKRHEPYLTVNSGKGERKRTVEPSSPRVEEANFLPAYRSMPSDVVVMPAIPVEKAASRYLQSPRYTHIRVPRLPTDVPAPEPSPLHLPKLEDRVNHARKPVTVSLTQKVRQAKVVRKQWNLRLLDEPSVYFTATQTENVVKFSSNRSAPEPSTRISAVNHHLSPLNNRVHATSAVMATVSNHQLSPRRQWNHPDFWPRQQALPGG